MKAFLLTSIFLTSISAQTICHSVYKTNIGQSQSKNLETLSQLNRVDDALGYLSKQIRKDEVYKSYYSAKIADDFNQIEKSLLNSDASSARVKIGSLYTRVEGAYLKIVQHNKLADALREAHQLGIRDIVPFLKREKVVDILIDLYGSRINSLDDIPRVLRQLDDDIAKEVKILGKNFQRYEYYSSSMNALKKADYCTASCKKAIRELESEIKILRGAKRTMIDDFVGIEKSVTLAKVRRVFNSHPETLLIQRKRELLFEGLGVLKRFVNKYGLLRKLTYYLADNVSPKYRRVFRMLRSVFDERYLAKHSKGIQRLINSELTPDQKYQLMKNEVKDLDEKMFWVDLARTRNAKAQDTWKELKDYVQKNNQVDELTKMQDAQKIAEILGSPRNRNIRNTIRIVSTLALVGGSVAYFSFGVEDDEPSDSNSNVIDLSGGDDSSSTNGNSLDLDQGSSVDLDNGSDVDLEQNTEDNDSVTVLIDYMSPEDREIEDLMIDLLELDRELNNEKDSP